MPNGEWMADILPLMWLWYPARAHPEDSMTQTEPATTTNLATHGSEAHSWSAVLAAISEHYPDPPTSGAEKVQHTVLGTVRPDGRPHAAPVGALWIDGSWYVVSGPEAQKSRNLANNSACTLTVKLPALDLVFSGDMQRVTDADELKRVAEVYHASGWPAEVQGDGLTAPFFAPGGGDPPWNLYRLAVREVVAIGTAADTDGGTKFTFA